MTLERVTKRNSNFIERELQSPHHVFLDQMKQYFEPAKFAALLKITKERLGTLNPAGEIPVFDKDVLGRTASVIQSASAYLNPEETRSLSAAAYFAIWAHGTNPNQKKRYRHETKPDSDDRFPYAVHLARVAERLIGLNGQTLQLAFLHDTTEDTVYKEEDINELFGSSLARWVKKATKISTDSLENLEQLGEVELGVAEKFLSQFWEVPEAEKAVEIIKKVLDTSGWNRERTIEDLKGYINWRVKANFPAADETHQIVFSTLRKYASEPQYGQILTLMRLLSVVNNPDDIPVLLVKCADVADNSSTLSSLQMAKGAKRASEKAKIAYDFFAPLASALGLTAINREIEYHAYKAQHPAEIDRIEKVSAGRPLLSERAAITIDKRFSDFKANFLEWVKSRYSVGFPENALLISLRYPDAQEIAVQDLYRQKKTRFPIVEFHISDELVAAALTEFIQTFDLAQLSMVIDQGAHDGGWRDKRVEIKVLYNRNFGKLTGFIRRNDGVVADLYRPAVTDVAREQGRIKLKVLQESYNSGDFGDFLERLGSGSKVVMIGKIGKRDIGYYRLFLPQQATLEDILVLSGHMGSSGQIFRLGKEIQGSLVENGDLVRVGGVNMMTPETYNHLTVPASFRLLDEFFKRELKHGYHGYEKLILEGALNRGIRIFSTLVDGFILQEIYKGEDRVGRNPAIGFLSDTFLEALFRHHRDLISHIINDEVLREIGFTPRAFPLSRFDFRLSDYHEWMKTTGVVEKIRKVCAWINTSCLEVYPSRFQNGDMSSSLHSMAALLNRITQKVKVTKIQYTPFDQDKPEEQFFYEICGEDESANLQRGDVSVEERKFNVIKRVLFVPVSDGQFEPSGRIYIVIDPDEYRALVDYTGDHSLIFDSESSYNYALKVGARRILSVSSFA